MKKALCLLMVLVMTLCLLSCNLSDNDKEIKDLKTLMLLCDAREERYKNYPQKLVMVMEMEMRLPDANDMVDAEFKTTLYYKEDGPDSVINGKIGITATDYMYQSTLVYYEKGTLYTFLAGKTYKQELNFEDALGTADISDSIDWEEITYDSSDSVFVKNDDGSYSVTIELDTEQDISFVNDMLESFEANGVTGMLSACIIELDVSADYVLDSVDMIFLAEVVENNTSYQVKYNVNITRTVLSKDYKIEPPEEIDIENAIGMDEEEL